MVLHDRVAKGQRLMTLCYKIYQLFICIDTQGKVLVAGGDLEVLTEMK